MTKIIVQINSELELLGFLKTNGTQCRFINITTETPVKKIKKGNPFTGLVKVSKKTGLINMSYCKAVERKLAMASGVNNQEVEYIPKETWYEHLKTNTGDTLPVVEHKTNKGKYYLQFFPIKSNNCYKLPNGELIKDEEVKPWLYTESPHNDFKPVVITIGLENIKRLAASGVIITTEDLPEAEAALSQAE